MVERLRLRRLATAQLARSDIAALRGLLWAAFDSPTEEDRFTEDDWQHALGGTHFVLHAGPAMIAHASVVERELHVAGRPIRTGYVEAVATWPDMQRSGHGTTVMRAVGEFLAERFELGALGTSSHGFYERLGWETWRGSTHVRAPDGTRATPEEDGYILVLRTSSTPDLDLHAPISCDWRAGDVW